MTSNKILATNVAKILAARKLSQNKAAGDPLTGGSSAAQTTFSNIVHGKGCTLATLDRVAKALDVPPYQLLIPGLPAAAEAQRVLARMIEVSRKMEIQDDEPDENGAPDSSTHDRPHDGRRHRG